MRGIDFSSWESVLSALLALALFAFIGVGVRLLLMMTIQQRRERMNRQINERLKTLIAAYKVLGGSFTGDLTVDPKHLRDLRPREADAADDAEADGAGSSDRSRRIRDAVETALSDIILLGTEEHVRLAQRAARELVEGRPVHTNELVVSLRDFIRHALDLQPIPPGLDIPMQGPSRPGGGGTARGDRGRAGQGGGGGGGMGAGGGMGMGVGMGAGVASGGANTTDPAA